MTTNIKFICFGNSVNNLKNAIEFNIIGLPKRHLFNEGEQLYFAIKVNKEWKICGRANAGKETDLNPFENPGRFYTYTVTNFEACIPYDIRLMSRQILGPYWALNFQTPRVIDNKEYCQFIQNSFISTDTETMLSKL